MITVTVQLPEEIEALIKAQGYDIASYINVFAIVPLLDRYEEYLRKSVLDQAADSIAAAVQTKKDMIVYAIDNPNAPVSTPAPTPVSAESPAVPMPSELPTSAESTSLDSTPSGEVVE